MLQPDQRIVSSAGCMRILSKANCEYSEMASTLYCETVKSAFARDDRQCLESIKVDIGKRIVDDVSPKMRVD